LGFVKDFVIFYHNKYRQILDKTDQNDNNLTNGRDFGKKDLKMYLTMTKI